MIINRLPLSVAAILTAAHASAVDSSEPGRSRVKPVALLIPLPDKASALPPDRLRAQSPWTLSVAGDWRFRLTHGRIVDGRFALSDAESGGLRASGVQGGHEAKDAFDGDPETRWCAPNGQFPQYLQAKLDSTPRIATSVDVVWERPSTRYACRIEGGDDGVHWRTLLDRSAKPGVGSGTLALPASGAPVRYLRVVVLGADDGSWASICELKIHYRRGNEDVVWKPARPTIAIPPHADDFVATGFDDRKWDKLAVPSNWEMAGYSIPTYDAVDDSVGLYRRWIDVPRSWSGRRIVWRFDGALDGADVYVNGKRAGYHESGYTAFDVDLTGLVQPGKRNLLAVRVCKTTPSVDAETGDYQCMGGIYRDTRLIAVPKTHVADLTVRTPLSKDFRDATLKVEARIEGTPGEKVRITGSVTDAATGKPVPATLLGNATIGQDGHALLALSSPVKAPKLWSAEKPALYYVTLDLRRGGETVERVEQRFGFRQIEIKNQVVLWNGKPIKCTGICRHDFWADKGFALTDAEWKKDLTMMKATNINAIRTSHYNHAARFLELCDERGFYVLDEVPFCWINDKVKDPKFGPPLMQRAIETLARDKNRPCVLAWSLGNENPTGINTQQMHDMVNRLDPTRPSFASQAGPQSVKGQELFDTHYPSPESLVRYVEKESSVAPLNITEHPHTFYSRETQEYDPGATDVWTEGMLKTWDLLWRSPTILGSFIWEWQNQGVADKFPDRTTDFYFGTDHMRQENNKGIVDAYRTPKAEQWIVKMVYSPVQFPSRTFEPAHGGCAVRVVNHYAFTDLGELAFRWTALKDGTVLGRGVAHVVCPPGGTVDAEIAAPSGLTALRIQVDRADGGNVTMANLAAPDAPAPAAPPASADRSPLTVGDTAGSLQVASASQRIVFDKGTGTLRSWTVGGKDRLGTGGPYLNLGEAKRARGDNRYYQADTHPVTDGATVTAETAADGTVHVVSRASVRPALGSTKSLGTLTVDYTIRPDAEIAVAYRLDWSAADTELWEFALCLPVPAGSDRQSWSRDGYLTAYPEDHIGAPTGICGPNEAAFRASKRSLHWLALTDRAGVGLALIAADAPLIGRATSDAKGVTLIASREIAAAGPDDLSRPWFRDHDIRATNAKPLRGAFVLRAIDAP